MDQSLHQICPEGIAPSHQLAPQSLSQQQNPLRQFKAPNDVDGALRLTPLTSVIPASGGKSSRVEQEVNFLVALNVLSSPKFACVYSSKLTVNPDQENRTQEYFKMLNVYPRSPTEEAFQREEFRNTVSLLNQVDDRHLYFPGLNDT
jgi:hypothetical protein